MATFNVTWTDGHFETIEAERYDHIADDGVYVFHNGTVGKPVVTVPHNGVRLIRRTDKVDV